jgi:hypothetical protein
MGGMILVGVDALDLGMGEQPNPADGSENATFGRGTAAGRVNPPDAVAIPNRGRGSEASA